VGLAAYGLASLSLHAQVNVTTYHNDVARSGANTQETTLTPANVNSTQFGKWFSAAVDGQVYAQPLYMSGVQIAGAARNVVYVATEHDSVYAIDAGNGVIYWHVSLIPAGGSATSAGNNNGSTVNCFLLTPEIGITGTPVIDPSTNTMYVVAEATLDGNVVHSLHAIDITTGAEKFGGPVAIQASAPGNSSDAVNGVVTFNPHQQLMRSALLLEHGHVVVGWSSNCDEIQWHGWVMSYNASTLAQEAVFNPSSNGYGNAIWMSGGGAAADTAGNVYFATGNGSWNGTTDYGDSIVKLGPPSGGSFPVVDWFTPYNQLDLAQQDEDVGSGGLTLLPALSSGAQLVVQASKQSSIYLLNSQNLGHSCTQATPACTSNDPQIVQEIQNASAGVYGSPAYWNGNLYWGTGSQTGTADHLRAYSFNANGSGLISATPTSLSPQVFQYGGPVPSISANGSSAGILWGLDDTQYGNFCSGGAGCQVLYAYDATNLANMLYNSSQAPNTRDVPGGAVKYATPTIANGEVFVGGTDDLAVYGLLSNAPSFKAVKVSLGTAANVNAIGALSVSPPGGGLDTNGYAYAASLLPGSLTWNGVPFSLGSSAAASGVSSTTLALPAGNFTALDILATGVNGRQLNQPFVVTYTDGSTTSVTQNLSDWSSPTNFAGETVAEETGYRILPSGQPSEGTWFIYGYSIPLNAAKTVSSLTLPNNRNVVLMAASLLGGTVSIPVSTPGFTLNASTKTLALAQNLGGSFNVTVAPTNGFNGQVTFTTTGIPSGVNTFLNPTTSASGTSLTVFVPAGIPVGTYPITMTGTSGTVTASTTVNLTIAGQAAFSLSAASKTLSVAQGTSGSDAITMVPVNGFSAAASFAASGYPPGVSCTFAPQTSSSGTTLSVSVSPSAVPGNYPVTVTAGVAATPNASAFTETTSVIVAVTAASTAPTFSLGVNPASVTLIHGGSTGATTAVAVNPGSGFNGTVSFSLAGIPPNLNYAFLRASSASGTTLVLYANSSVSPGTYAVSIVGTAGTVSASTKLALVIQ